MDFSILAMSKKYTDDSIEGTTGVIAGKNCTIDSITDITGGHRITFKWTADSGESRTSTLDVMNGTDGQNGEDGQDGVSPSVSIIDITGGHTVTITDSSGDHSFNVMDGEKGEDGSKGDDGNGVKSVAINAQNHLIVTLDDDTPVDAGEITGINTDTSHITDFGVSNPTDGQVLKYNGTTHKWENASAGTVSTSLADLSDVNLSSVSDGQIIVWDATSGKWKNVNNSSSITVDSELSDVSENPVQNKVVKGAIDSLNSAKQPKTLATALTIDGASKTTVEDALSALNSGLHSFLNGSTETDCNECIPADGKSNVYIVSSSVGANSPNNNYPTFVLASRNGDYITQVAMSYILSSNSNNRLLYIRFANWSSSQNKYLWSSWVNTKSSYSDFSTQVLSDIRETAGYSFYNESTWLENSEQIRRISRGGDFYQLNLVANIEDTASQSDGWKDYTLDLGSGLSDLFEEYFTYDEHYTIEWLNLSIFDENGLQILSNYKWTHDGSPTRDRFSAKLNTLGVSHSNDEKLYIRGIAYLNGCS